MLSQMSTLMMRNSNKFFRRGLRPTGCWFSVIKFDFITQVCWHDILCSFVIQCRCCFKPFITLYTFVLLNIFPTVTWTRCLLCCTSWNGWGYFDKFCWMTTVIWRSRLWSLEVKKEFLPLGLLVLLSDAHQTSIMLKLGISALNLWSLFQPIALRQIWIWNWSLRLVLLSISFLKISNLKHLDVCRLHFYMRCIFGWFICRLI